MEADPEAVAGMDPATMREPVAARSAVARGATRRLIDASFHGLGMEKPIQPVAIEPDSRTRKLTAQNSRRGAIHRRRACSGDSSQRALLRLNGGPTNLEARDFPNADPAKRVGGDLNH
jgi:hypothetical protein